MICSVKLDSELTAAFFDAAIAKKHNGFTREDLEFISKQNPNSAYARFNKQFLSNLLSEADQFGLTVKCAEYHAGDIRLNISHGDPDDWHMPGGLCMVLNAKSTVFITALSFNDFKILSDNCAQADYIADYYRPFSKTPLKKAGWAVQKINGKNIYVSGTMPGFSLALFKKWIDKTAKIRDSIEEASRKIEKQDRILELKFDAFSAHIEKIKALAEEKFPGVKCKLETSISMKECKLTLYNALIPSEGALVLANPASGVKTIVSLDILPQMRTLKKVAMADSCWLYRRYALKMAMDGRGFWKCETDSLLPEFKQFASESPAKVVEWIAKLFDAETEDCAAA